MKQKEDGKERVDSKNKLTQLDLIAKKTALVTAIGALGLAPTVQAFEGARSSGFQTQGFEFEPLLGREDVGLSSLSSRRSEVNRVGELGRSMDYMSIEEMERNLAVREGDENALDFDTILARGILYMNRDVASMELNFSASEVASSPHIQMTLEQPMVLSIYDPVNDIGTIVKMESKRHSDGSARMYQRFIGPSFFDRISDGGGLTDMQYETMKSVLGSNPAEDHRGSGERRHAFSSITPTALATLAGLVMHNSGATFGLHINNIPEQRYWKTKRGRIRVKITHHLESKVRPDISMIVPRTGFVGGMYPMYTRDQGDGTERLIFGGVKLLDVTDAGSSFDLDPYLLDYRTKTERGWSGIAVAIFAAIAVAAVVATGGALGVAVLGGISPGVAAAFTFGVVAGVSAASGTLFDKATTSLPNVTSVTSKDSGKNWSGHFEQANRKYRDLILNGPLNERYSGVNIPTSRQINRQIVSQWHHHIDPLYDIQGAGFEYRPPQLNVQQRPQPSEFFNNIHDNPNFNNRKRYCGSGLFISIILCNNIFGGGGDN